MSEALSPLAVPASATAETVALPEVALPRAPRSALLWSRAVDAASIVMVLFTLNAITLLLGDFWLLQSLGFSSVFWTNFKMGATLYVTALVAFGAAMIVPAFTHEVERVARVIAIKVGFLAASIGAYFLALHYHDFLLGGVGLSIGKTDPVFGIDLAFYLFNLPNIWIAWGYAFAAALAMLGSSIAFALAQPQVFPNDPTLSRVGRTLARISTMTTRVALALAGLIGAIGIWLGRFELLYKDNYDSSVRTGAEYLDLVGLFSNLNYINVTTLVALGVTASLFLLLGHLHRGAEGWRPHARKLGWIVLALIALDGTFKAMVEARNWIAVKPNEPVIQLPYIARHIEATREAFKLDRVQELNFKPAVPGDPLPNPDALLASATLRNAPLWPGFASYLERWLDNQHAQRIIQTQGDSMVYGPTLELFNQQQKLRMYYEFLGVDTVRYPINGETKMLVSSVREAPLHEPKPWLTYWGQRFMLFTHGFGLVMAPAGEVNEAGEPRFVSKEIPTQTAFPELKLDEERIYYGEGSATMAFSNVDRMKELDYPTEQDREQIFLPADIPAGVKIDSLLKRVVFGWRSSRFFELVFSDLITDSTRVHFYRTPVERLQRLAPFVFFESNPYAVKVDGKVVWIVNGITTSDRYPYSWPGELGDKSDERNPIPHAERKVNYVEDSVKATVDALTGQVKLYQIADEPVANAWAKIYPGLFTPKSEMPEDVRRQLTYPVQLFHQQFDDHYIYYHMREAMYFFNQEDPWDDADEVLGPVLDQGEAITFSMEPYFAMLETGGTLPEAKQRVQFAMMMPFTPENALNLRAIPIAYQDGDDYGKLAVLQVPKGTYVIGPEQADATIDQDPQISQHFAWWNRRGMEVIRGHTTLLPIGNEVIYVEPIFLRSQQNPVTQLKKVVVVFRGQPFMADTLDQAIRGAIAQAERKES